MRGRKPRPTHVKLVTGNPGKRPLNRAEPRPAGGLPQPPAELTDDAKTEWRRVARALHQAGLLATLDRAALAAYCQAYARWRAAEKALADMAARDPLTSGLLIKTSNGNAIQNPLVGIANKAAAAMVRYAAEFGMTPSARSRIAAAPSDGAGAGDPARNYF
jgi:P27 family predicted phage terminase small subunit